MVLRSFDHLIFKMVIDRLLACSVESFGVVCERRNPFNTKEFSFIGFIITLRRIDSLVQILRWSLSILVQVTFKLTRLISSIRIRSISSKKGSPILFKILIKYLLLFFIEHRNRSTCLFSYWSKTSRQILILRLSAWRLRRLLILARHKLLLTLTWWRKTIEVFDIRLIRSRVHIDFDFFVAVNGLLNRIR